MYNIFSWRSRDRNINSVIDTHKRTGRKIKRERESERVMFNACIVHSSCLPESYVFCDASVVCAILFTLFQRLAKSIIEEKGF